MVITRGQSNYSDVHFTDTRIAAAVVDHYHPSGRCLEPFKGNGVFMQFLPPDASWCEITEGKDFFDWTEAVDWIVTNPPFSNMTQVLNHSFSVSDNCVFVIPISKYWSSAPRIESVARYGGLVEIAHLGRGRDIGFNIGFPFAAMHFKRGYQGQIRQSVLSV